MLNFILQTGIENIFHTKYDKYRKEDIAENDEQRMSKIAEGHGTQHHCGNLINGGEDEGVEKYPTEVFHSRNRTVDVLELVIATIQKMSDIGTEEHHQGAGECGNAEGVGEGVHHEPRGKSDEILQGERQLQRQEKKSQQEKRRRHISKQANMLTYNNLHNQKDDKS